jgi:hypothetical protein
MASDVLSRQPSTTLAASTMSQTVVVPVLSILPAAQSVIQ